MNPLTKLFFLFGIVFMGCQSPTNETVVTKPSRNLPDVFQKIMDAHGGLEQWEVMKTLEFTKGEGAAKEYHTVDLETRKSLIEVKDKYKLGNDGEHVWVTPHRDSFPGKSPRFMHNLYFYFVAIPYVLADPGVTYEDMGEQMIGEQKYRVLKTGFEANIGDAPEDKYFLYVDPVTYKVDFITYSVTYFDASKATKYNALKYEWAESNGLLVPTKMIGYKWVDGALGDERYTRNYDMVKYSKTKTNPQIFEVPEGAFKE